MCVCLSFAGWLFWWNSAGKRSKNNSTILGSNKIVLQTKRNVLVLGTTFRLLEGNVINQSAPLKTTDPKQKNWEWEKKIMNCELDGKYGMNKTNTHILGKLSSQHWILDSRIFVCSRFSYMYLCVRCQKLHFFWFTFWCWFDCVFVYLFFSFFFVKILYWKWKNMICKHVRLTLCSSFVFFTGWIEFLEILSLYIHCL